MQLITQEEWLRDFNPTAGVNLIKYVFVIKDDICRKCCIFFNFSHDSEDEPFSSSSTLKFFWLN